MLLVVLRTLYSRAVEKKNGGLEMAGGLETAQEGSLSTWSPHIKHLNWLCVRHT
jgi:hypothetical protein